ncbi:MAG: EAL domain-containing protein [Rhodocyclaceae bacterium]|nr:EAL domain-containing protein [Rhodocyclaceae bacterium]
MIRSATAAMRGGVSIRLRLLAMMMAVVSVAAVGGYALFAYRQIGAQEERLLAISRSLAEVLSQDFARLVFLNDAAVATDVTARLAAFPGVRRALLLDSAAEALYEFSKDEAVAQLPMPENLTHAAVDRDGMHLRQPVVYEGQPVGALYLLMESDTLAAVLRRDLVTLLEVAVLSLLLALVLAVRFEKRFNAPILRLVDFLDRADADSALERRMALPGGDDEFARLYRAVNALLDRIQTSHAGLRQAASVFEHANEGILIADREGKILDVNAAFTRITLYDREEVLGKSPRILQSGRHGQEFYAAMWRALHGTGNWSGEIWNRRKGGEVYPELLTISAIKAAGGETQGYVALLYDISQIKEQQRKLEHLAHYDALTGLPNRTLLADRLQQAMRQARRRSHRVAAIYLDLDGFTAINGAHGHALGDKLLVALAGRLQLALRDGDILARLGGDEFVVVLPDLADPAAATPVVERLLRAAAEPLPIDGLLLQTSASIGVSFYPQTGEIDADQLLRQADQAMYRAKQSGKNRFHLFDAEQDRVLRGRHESIERIGVALKNGEFALFYQPKINLRSGAVIGFEALIRWQHPERGLVPPVQFLPLIEDHNLIVLVGDWTIESALAQMEVWHGNGLALPVSVNVAGRQLQAPDFFDKLKAALSRHPAAARQLELEVLENSALEDMAGVARTLAACNELGVGFALDDFGAGYSSLTYLKRLPAQTLKIDQDFVRDMLESPDDLSILAGIVALAEAFGRSVIAEGVETPAHGEMLLRLGCDLAQGYAIARPMPADAVVPWLASWHPDGLCRKFAHVGNERMPVLQAIIELGAWVADLRRHLRDEALAAPSSDRLHRRLAAWLDRPAIAEIVGCVARLAQLHKAAQRLTGDLLELRDSGRAGEALTRFSEVEACRDALIDEIHRWLDA